MSERDRQLGWALQDATTHEEREGVRAQFGDDDVRRVCDVITRSRDLRAYLDMTERLLIDAALYPHLEREERITEVNAMFRVAVHATASKKTRAAQDASAAGRSLVLALAQVARDLVPWTRDDNSHDPTLATAGVERVRWVMRSEHPEYDTALAEHALALHSAVHAWIESVRLDGRGDGESRSKWKETVDLLAAIGINVGAKAAQAWLREKAPPSK